MRLLKSFQLPGRPWCYRYAHDKIISNDDGQQTAPGIFDNQSYRAGYKVPLDRDDDGNENGFYS